MNQKLILTLTRLLIVGATSLVAGSSVNIKDVKSNSSYYRANIEGSTIGTSVNIKGSRGTVKDVKSSTTVSRSTVKDSKIGTSVKVAKYINAPTIEAKRFENNEFPPTS